jgi:hypothetical protein
MFSMNCSKTFQAALTLTFAAALAIQVQLAQAQQPVHRPAYDGSAAPNAPLQIHIDQDCRILPDPAHPLPGKKQKPYSDSTICQIESAHDSEHTEEYIDGNQLQRSKVRVQEQTYVLQNIAPEMVIFVLQVPVPNNWMIDSDPKPARMEGSVAFFPCYAKPGEIVHLHIGMRHTTAMKPKPL